MGLEGSMATEEEGVDVSILVTVLSKVLVVDDVVSVTACMRVVVTT
jgi:hypothetical protein